MCAEPAAKYSENSNLKLQVQKLKFFLKMRKKCSLWTWKNELNIEESLKRTIDMLLRSEPDILDRAL